MENCCIYINKNKVKSCIDRFNDGLVNLVEKMDEGYNKLGECISRNYNLIRISMKSKYTNNNRSHTYAYTNIISSPTPLSENTYQENVSIIVSEDNLETNSENNIIKRKLSQNSSSSNSSIEMIPKHYIGNKESFLDEAWDIIASS
jgi:hypothetical protein